MAELHIHAPKADERQLYRLKCPTCKKPRFFLAWFYDWYGWDQTCLGCGEHWSGGEMCERPFMRGWRKKSIDAAKKRWRAETKSPPGEQPK